jgi:hypothetical protein
MNLNGFPAMVPVSDPSGLRRGLTKGLNERKVADVGEARFEDSISPASRRTPLSGMDNWTPEFAHHDSVRSWPITASDDRTFGGQRCCGSMDYHQMSASAAFVERPDAEIIVVQ